MPSGAERLVWPVCSLSIGSSRSPLSDALRPRPTAGNPVRYRDSDKAASPGHVPSGEIVKALSVSNYLICLQLSGGWIRGGISATMRQDICYYRDWLWPSWKIIAR
jgi:hypothetical protein